MLSTRGHTIRAGIGNRIIEYLELIISYVFNYNMSKIRMDEVIRKGRDVQTIVLVNT